MTVTTTNNRITYTGDGSTTAFPFPYLFLASTDIQVYVASVKQTTGFTVTGAGDASGGTVTFNTAPAADASIVLYRDPDALQGTSLPANGPFPAKSVETMVDKVTLGIQRLRELVLRSARLAESDTSGASTVLPTPSANLGLKWNSDGSGLINTSTDPDTYAAAAAASATTAAASETAAAASESSAASSAASAAASAATVNLPSVIGKALNFLRVAAGETGYEMRTPSQVRGDIGAASSGANTDITSLEGLTTPLSRAQGGTGGTTGSVPVRQTVLSGPVDTSGFSAFGGSTGSTTVTASGALVVTAANGFDAYGPVNRIGQITNPSWTGITASGPLYIDIAADGTCTTGSTTLFPVYQWGGSYSTTNGQFNFNIQEMTGKVGDGSTATQVYRVFVGEVTVSGGVVTAITWYALQGRYNSSRFSVAASTSYSKSHKLGVQPYKFLLLGASSAGGALVPVVPFLTSAAAAANNGASIRAGTSVGRLSLIIDTLVACSLPNGLDGNNQQAAVTMVEMVVIAERGWQ